MNFGKALRYFLTTAFNNTFKICTSTNLHFPVSRYHISQAKLEEKSPNFTLFLHLVKSRWKPETKAGDTKKWIPCLP